MKWRHLNVNVKLVTPSLALTLLHTCCKFRGVNTIIKRRAKPVTHFPHTHTQAHRPRHTDQARNCAANTTSTKGKVNLTFAPANGKPTAITPNYVLSYACPCVPVCASVGYWGVAGADARGQQLLMFDFIQSKLTDDAKSFHSIKF